MKLTQDETLRLINLIDAYADGVHQEVEKRLFVAFLKESSADLSLLVRQAAELAKVRSQRYQELVKLISTLAEAK